MKLATVVLQLAAVAFAAMLGSTNAQTTECTVQASATGTGNEQLCNDAASCFATAIEIEKDSTGLFVDIAPGCQSLLGSRLDLTLNSAETELSGKHNSYTLLFKGVQGGYSATISDGTNVCVAPLARTSGTCPVPEAAAPAGSASAAHAVATGAVALAAVGAALAL